MGLINWRVVSDLRNLFVFAFVGAAFGIALSGEVANAQAKAPVAKVAPAAKTGLKQALTLDVVTLEAQARAAWGTLTTAREQLATAEAAVSALTPGTTEYDTATESWLKAQGVAMLAQEEFDLAARAFDEGRKLRGEAATAFVDERCANDDGKDPDIARVCAKLAAAKAEAAAKAAAVVPGDGPHVP